jgi:hypothetical protein
MAVTTETLREQFIKAGNKMVGNDQSTHASTPRVGKTHPEAPADGRDETPSIVSECSFIVEGQILDGQIRSQKIQQKKHELRGNIAKTERKKLWADTEEVKRDIQRDDLDATKQRRELNREGHTQSLAAKSYTVEQTRSRNNGMRQKLVNEGVTLKLDHLQGFDAAVGRKKEGQN